MSWASRLKKISPGTAGQGCQCQLFPTAPLDSASTPRDTWHKHSSSCHPGKKMQSTVKGQDIVSTNWNIINCLNRDKNFLTLRVWVARCWNWLPRKAVKCPCLEMLRIRGMWLALSSLLQLSLLWAGNWSRWSPEVPANPSPYCASVSYGEMVATQGLPKHNSDFCCFPTHAIEFECLTGETGWKWFQLIFFLWIKNGCFPTYCRARWNKVKEGHWPTGCIGSSRRMGWAIK